MKFTISGKNIDVTEGLKAAVRDKLGKLERYFTPDTEVIVTMSVEKERQKIEVTIPVKGNIIRSEQVSNDMYVSIDLVEEVIERHSCVDYRVYMMGFLPGFAYLGGLDKRLEMPRLKTPRVKIPAGAVGIGGSQTGVYPMDSPGGWRLIGGTPVDFYNPEREEPILCRAGDYIRFVPITMDDYYDIRHMILRREYRVEVEEG